MVLEADKLGCATEVIVIAAALSIQDPRERPQDKQAQADQSHARFADERLGLHRVPEPVAATCASCAASSRRTSSASAASPSTCTTSASASGRTWSSSCARPPRASASRSTARRPSRATSTSRCCPGCCRTSGSRRARREYVGARGARFAIFPGSALARKNPDWVMAAELVETSRLWGRDGRAARPAVDRAAGRPSAAAHVLGAALVGARADRWWRPSA